MDSNYLQTQRFQLQKRMRRLNSCDATFFHSSLVQFWNFLKSHLIFGAVLEKLENEAPLHEDKIKALGERTFDLFGDETEAIHFSFRLLQHCVTLPMELDGGFVNTPELDYGHTLGVGSNKSESLEAFRDVYLDPFYEYLDGALDQTGAILGLLVKYRQRVEWFYRERVAHMATDGERKLAPDLYAYLHDQGLEFTIEPQGPSGIPDLVSRELVADAKIFDGERRSVSYVASGVNQVLTYLRDFNQIVGYLVIYRTCPRPLHFSFETPDRHFPFLRVGGKIIYLVVIDICDYEHSASKRGSLEAFNVDEVSLVKDVPIISGVEDSALQPSS